MQLKYKGMICHMNISIPRCQIRHIEDTLIVTMGSKEEHKKQLHKVLTNLYDENFTNSIEKCKFACEQLE